jgi:hypothetical protein
VLTAAPYSLPIGESIFAKVSASNFYGESALSLEGNGAVVLLVPDAPINLSNAISVTTGYVIGFNWDDGLSYGGTPIIDYRITYD